MQKRPIFENPSIVSKIRTNPGNFHVPDSKLVSVFFSEIVTDLNRLFPDFGCGYVFVLKVPNEDIYYETSYP